MSRSGSERSSTLIKGLSVLRLVAPQAEGCTISQAARGVEISRAAARRFLLTLCDEGYLRQSQSLFLPTPKISKLADTPIADGTFWNTLLPPMKHVADETGEACSMSVMVDHDIIYVARAPSRRVVSVHLEVGSRLPAAHTSMGRVMLASQPKDAIAHFLDLVDLPRRTRFSISESSRLRDAISASASDGFSIVDQELEEGLISVAVPVTAPNGAVLSALNFSSTPTRYPSKRLRESIVPMLQAASRDITEILRAAREIASIPQKETLQ